MKSLLTKKRRFTLSLVLIIALLTATIVFAAANSWQNVGLACFSAGQARYTSLALDSSGMPYVAYRDNNESDTAATVMKYENGNWTTVGLPGFTAKAASYISLAFDNSSTPYVAYKDYNELDNAATVMKYTGIDPTGWETVGSAGFSAWQAEYTSMAFDSSGTPYVAYQDWGNDYKATVMRYENGNWDTVGLAGFSAGKAAYTSLALDSSATPYVAYRDKANSYKATVMKYENGNWTIVGLPSFSDGQADYTSLALDSGGTPYVAYADHGKEAKATVMTYTGSITETDATDYDGWEYVGSAGFSAGPADYISLALDSSGTPYVAYKDGGNSSRATVMKYTGIGLTGWETVGSTGFSAGQADHTSLALDSNGKPYVAYQDVGNGSGATVMAYLPSPTVSTSSPASGATIQSTSTLTVDFNKDMLHDGTANAADNVANYLLVEEGDVADFQTTTCAIGAVGGDTEITILSTAYSNNGGSGPYRATLGVAPLENGSYQLLACGSATIHDMADNPLNGGTDSVITFTVAAAVQGATAQPETLPQTGFAPDVITQLPKQGLSDTYQQFNFVSLEIPSLGVEAPIVGVPVSQEGWDLTWLGDQAGWLHGTAFPSWAGNSAITAHVYDANGQPGLFNDLDGLKWGDEVIVHAYGQAYVYEVRTVEKYIKPDDTSSVFQHEDYPWLTLITCKGYDKESDYYNWRVVVRAIQTKIG